MMKHPSNRRLPAFARTLAIYLVVFTGLFISAPRPCAQVPDWIWHDNKGAGPQPGEERFFRKTFSLPQQTTRVLLTVTADDEAEVYVNGAKVATVKSHKSPARVDISKSVQPGDNVIAARCRNAGGPAGFIARMDITITTGNKDIPENDAANRRVSHILSDATWISTAKEQSGWQELKFTPAGWTKTVSLGKLGVAPWGDVLTPPEATPASELALAPGFKAELLHSAQFGDGSWVCMTIDPKGRLIVSPQDLTAGDEGGLMRITLPKAGKHLQIERLRTPVGAAQGLLYAHGSLYVNGRGPDGLGLYRLRDTTRDDQFDEVRFLMKFDGSGEHGPHAVVLGPDKMLYIMNGNHTKPPENLSPASPHRNFQEDLLLPRQWDANGHAVGVLAPGGYVLRIDPEGKTRELVAAGFRNAYDIAFNMHGELFTYDSDMEWDVGAPWYRPVRVNHVVAGGEYGWRSGTGKWPGYYPDSLPTTVDMGRGSPTGVKFGTGSRFPARLQRALFVCDWAYGTIHAVHLKPDGATYSATYEPFVTGKPLNVTDLEFGLDGAMYFITGGRGTQSGLYRITHTGPAVKDPTPTRAERRAASSASKARELRQKLEQFHGKENPRAVDAAWPHLDSADRWLRYAARIAVESQPIGQWKARALAETRPNAGLNALLALARSTGRESQNELLQALTKFPFESLSEEQQLEKLRVISLSFIRQGYPDNAMATLAQEKLDRQYPAASEALNRELAQLLVHLDSPTVVEKTLRLLAAAPTQEEQLHYAFALRTARRGWTMEHRRAYFEWFAKAEKDYKGGNSFTKFLANFRKDAAGFLSAAEKEALAGLLGEEPKPAVPTKERAFVKNWTLDDITPLLDHVSTGRSFQSGKEAYAAAQCAACHRFGNEGGAVGPDLTAAASRFNRRDLLEAIIEPSKVVSDQYHNIVVYKKDDTDYTGRLVDEDSTKIVLVTNPITQDRVEILKQDIASRSVSELSPMPEGLLDVLSRDEILDLLAYVESGGKRSHPAFANEAKKP